MNGLQQWWQRYESRFNQLPDRDRRALLALVAFLLIAGFGSGLWSLYQYHQKAYRQAEAERATLFWMQSQAASLQPTLATPQPMLQLVPTLASSQGLTVSTSQQGDRMLITASHSSYAVLAGFLSRLAEQGVVIENLSMQQAGGLIQLQATLLQSAA